MPDTNDIRILEKISNKFIDAINDIISIYARFPNSVNLKEKFSLVLIKIYQMFMLEQLTSCQLLVKHQKIFGFSALCRSTLDIIIQLKWILSLETQMREKAINCFLKFEGMGRTEKGKDIYEWQKLIDPGL